MRGTWLLLRIIRVRVGRALAGRSVSGMPLVATLPCKQTRATPFGQFISCTSAKPPTLTLQLYYGELEVGRVGRGGRAAPVRFSVALHKTKRPTETPASTNQAVVLHELFGEVVLQLTIRASRRFSTKNIRALYACFK